MVRKELEDTVEAMNKAWTAYQSLREQSSQLQSNANRAAEDVASLQHALFSAKQLEQDETTSVGERPLRDR